MEAFFLPHSDPFEIIKKKMKENLRETLYNEHEPQMVILNHYGFI